MHTRPHTCLIAQRGSVTFCTLPGADTVYLLELTVATLGWACCQWLHLLKTLFS